MKSKWNHNKAIKSVILKKIYNKIQNNFLRADVFGQAQDEHFRQEQGM